MRIPCPSDRTPYDDDDGITALQEEIGKLCDAAGLDYSATDRILAAVIAEENVLLAAKYAAEADAMAAEEAEADRIAKEYWAEVRAEEHADLDRLGRGRCE